MKQDSSLRAVIFRDGDQWIAQCLEFDIGAQAKTLEQLYCRLHATINAEKAESLKVHGKEFAGIDQAPKYYFDMWDKQSGIYVPTGTKESQQVEMALVA